MPSDSKESIADVAQPLAAAQDMTGRAVFAVDTSAAGIVVRTAFLAEQGQLIEMPAIFPDLSYALTQIDQLRQIVIDRFAQAAQVGVQVIAAQQGANGNNAQPAANVEALQERQVAEPAIA